MRIVSKPEYVVRQLVFAALASGGCILAVIGTAATIIGVLAAGIVLMIWLMSPTYTVVIGGGLFCTFLFLIAYITMRYGGAMVDESAQMEHVLPLTRRTAASVPEEDCLLRSSGAAADDGTKTLLRADTANAATELLRPGP